MPIASGFVLFPDVTQLDFTGPHQVLSRLPGARVFLASRTDEPIEAGGYRMLRGGQHEQYGLGVAVPIRAPFPAEDAFAVLPKDVTTVGSLDADA